MLTQTLKCNGKKILMKISGGIEVGQILWRSLKETTHYYAGSDFISLSDLITELLKNT